MDMLIWTSPETESRIDFEIILVILDSAAKRWIEAFRTFDLAWSGCTATEDDSAVTTSSITTGASWYILLLGLVSSSTSMVRYMVHRRIVQVCRWGYRGWELSPTVLSVLLASEPTLPATFYFFVGVITLLCCSPSASTSGCYLRVLHGSTAVPVNSLTAYTFKLLSFSLISMHHVLQLARLLHRRPVSEDLVHFQLLRLPVHR